ncbi:MAG: hypothetical protein RR549_00220 [Oscillospiraceae bacterium]
MINTISTNHKHNKFDKAIGSFFNHHQCLSFLALYIAMPLFILFSVFVCSSIVILPIGFIMGWL